MSLSIKNPLIQTNNPLIRKQQIEILQRLREPETFHFVIETGRRGHDVVDGAVAIHGRGVFLDGLEHFPACFAPVRVAGYAVHVPDGFDGFGAVGEDC